MPHAMPHAMTHADLSATARIARHPIHPMLVPIPIACFVGTLLSDIAYWRTAEMGWANMSAWLVSVGVVVGLLAALFGLVDLVGSRGVRSLSAAWLHAGGNLVVLVLASANMLVHTRDAWTSVVPLGLALSAATVVVLVFTGWMGWTLVYRYHAGAAP
jgi:uncharacterized membrane protein